MENRDAKLVAKAVTASFFSHAGQLESDGGKMHLSVRGKHELYIFTQHLCCSEASPKWQVFHSTIILERYYMWNVPVMDPVWLTEAGSHFYHFGSTLAGVEGRR